MKHETFMGSRHPIEYKEMIGVHQSISKVIGLDKANFDFIISSTVQKVKWCCMLLWWPVLMHGSPIMRHFWVSCVVRLYPSVVLVSLNSNCIQNWKLLTSKSEFNFNPITPTLKLCHKDTTHKTWCVFLSHLSVCAFKQLKLWKSTTSTACKSSSWLNANNI